MKTRIGVLLLAVLGGWLLARTATARPRETGFLDRTLTLNGVAHRYQVYVPANYYERAARRTRWPVILFLHGAGERGTDGLLQTQVGLPASLRRHVERWPAVVVMPQCPAEQYWTMPAMMELALTAFEQTTRAFRTDPDRQYLTGLSMGGYGAWKLAATYPGKFAAVVPICGGARLPAVLKANDAVDPGAYTALAQGIGPSAPVWAFHGAKDTVVPVTESRQLVAALQQAGGSVRYTEYPEATHDSWTAAYDDPELPRWLLQQRRSPARK
ncbi:carboxylesterase family protein [Hymenobacter coalescens]